MKNRRSKVAAIDENLAEGAGRGLGADSGGDSMRGGDRSTIFGGSGAGEPTGEMVAMPAPNRGYAIANKPEGEGRPGIVGQCGADGESGYGGRAEMQTAILGLNEAQCKAIEMLWGGYGLVAAAAGAGVNRTTLYRWLKYDRKFAAAYAACGEFMVESARHQLRGLSQMAVNHIGRAIASGDTKTALAVLKAVAAMGGAKRDGGEERRE